jgi:hypothetical protein
MGGIGFVYTKEYVVREEKSKAYNRKTNHSPWASFR